MDDLDDIVAEFLVESHENLDQLDRDLVALELDPSARPLLASIFRSIHTIKGTSGFLALSKLEAVAHAGENLLSRLRDGALDLTPTRTSALLMMVDCVRDLLNAIETNGSEGAVETEGVLAVIAAAQLEQADAPGAPSAPVAAVAEDAAASSAAITDASDVAAEPVATIPPAHVDENTLLTEVIPEQATSPEGGPEVQFTPGSSKAAESTIRVDVDLLDTLMRLVGELVLTRNQIVQHAARQDESDLHRYSQRLNLIASELQEGVMKTRMQPIDHLWSKLPRVVRDLGIQCGKAVRLELEGGETELDKTLLEAIKDPITHLVRNTVDHGIEPPDERVQRGKPAEGVLSLRAVQEGGQVVVEVVDDGRGIDPVKVGAKAVDRGLITSEQLSRMTQSEIQALVFHPGFSTAAAVTNVSGRGVGMDVVRTNIEKIGGSVDLSSVPGQGTTVRVKIPLTLAIIPALVVQESGDRYAIPQASLLELVRLEGDTKRDAIEHIGEHPVFRLRGKLLPLVDLGDVLDRPSGTDDDAVNIVVLQADGTPFGLIVDGISDTQEIVVKPLGRQLRHLSVFAGATIMGDGGVALILDVLGLAERANISRSGQVAVGSGGAANDSTEGDITSLLVLSAGGSRLAVPLSSVSRIEEISTSSIELAGSREVVQYRGELLPIVRLGRYVGSPLADSEKTQLPVVVHAAGGHSIGFAVDEILDIAQVQLVLHDVGRKPGVLGSMVVQERVTDVVDVDALLRELANV